MSDMSTSFISGSPSEDRFPFAFFNTLFPSKKDIRGCLKVHIFLKGPQEEKRFMEISLDNPPEALEDVIDKMISSKDEHGNDVDIVSIRDKILDIEVISPDSRELQMTVFPTLSQFRSLEFIRFDCQSFGTFSLNVLDTLTSLKRLEICRSKVKTLTYIENGSIETYNIKSIILKGNHLTTLPEEVFKKMRHLESLELSGNSLSKVPNGIEHLINLKFLDLQENPLIEMPDAMTLLTNLNELRIGGIQSKVPFLAKKYVLGNIQSLKNLRVFYLTGINGVQDIPSSVYLLNHLNSLNLERNGMSTVSEALTSLESLSSLVLRDNKLKGIPNFLVALKELKHLDVSLNIIESIPEEFNQLSKLTTLNLSRNHLTALPAKCLYLPNLTKLNLSRNKLSIVTKNELHCTHLKQLDMSFNEMKNFMIDLSKYDALADLNLEGNLISSIQTLHFLTRIKSLNLNNNDIYVLPKFTSLTTLTQLYISNIYIKRDLEKNSFIANTIGHTNEKSIKQLIALCANTMHPMLIFALCALVTSKTSNESMIRDIIVNLVSEGAILQYVEISERHHNQEYQIYALKALRIITRDLLLLDSVSSETILLPHVMNILLDETSSESCIYYAQCILCNLSQSPEIRKSIDINLIGERLQSLLNSNVKKISQSIKLTMATIGYHVRRDPTRGIRILALDGGGTRGITTVIMLSFLEELTGKPIHDMFDIIIGTSTGAFIAALIGIKKRKTDGLINFYKELCRHIFTPKGTTHMDSIALNILNDSQEIQHDNSPTEKSSTWDVSLPFQRISGLFSMISTRSFYDAKPLENIVHEVFDPIPLIQTSMSSDIKLIFTSTHASVSPVHPFIFRNYNHHIESKSPFNGSSMSKIWLALRSSSAAPGYFDEVTLPTGETLVDGGILYNNPTPVGVKEAKALWPDVPIELIVSCGTGKPQMKESVMTLPRLVTSIVDSATETEKTDSILRDFLPPDVYYRLQPKGEAFDFPLVCFKTNSLYNSSHGFIG